MAKTAPRRARRHRLCVCSVLSLNCRSLWLGIKASAQRSSSRPQTLQPWEFSSQLHTPCHYSVRTFCMYLHTQTAMLLSPASSHEDLTTHQHPLSLLLPCLLGYFLLPLAFCPFFSLMLCLSLTCTLSHTHTLSIRDMAYTVKNRETSESPCSFWTCVRLKDIPHWSPVKHLGQTKKFGRLPPPFFHRLAQL